MTEWPDLLPSLQPWVSDVRGQLIPTQSLAEMTTLRVGGPAQLFFRPADEAEIRLTYRELSALIEDAIRSLR